MIMKRLISLIGVCILLICTPCKAEITPQLMMEWSRQPANIQDYVIRQNTNIYVVDQLPWTSVDLVETYAYTTMNDGSIDIYIKRGCEFSLTHELGHVLSNTDVFYGKCYQPEFIYIWNVEKYNNVLLVGQGENDVREYFAEAYNQYINFPQILYKSCPLTYNYMKGVIKCQH